MLFRSTIMSRVRADRLTNKTGTGAPSLPNGVVVSGVTTTGSLSASGNVTASGSISAASGTITGNLDVGGVLTYEDVTNVDSVGIVTARAGIRVGTGQSISPVSGTIFYYGDGSKLTGVISGIGINTSGGNVGYGVNALLYVLRQIEYAHADGQLTDKQKDKLWHWAYDKYGI